MKLCIDCRWHEDGYCQNPRNPSEHVSIVNPVTGDIRKDYRLLWRKYCSAQRTGMLTSWIGCRLSGICGAEGRWFTPKETP